MDDPPLLSIDLLEELAARWRAHKLPILDNLRLGISDDDIDTIVGPLGLGLPTEGKVWWGWHDGANVPRGYADDRYVGSHLEFLPLANAARHYEESRASFDEIGQPADLWWPKNQFIITRKSSGDITFDSSVPQESPSPIFSVLHHDRNPHIDFKNPAARSFGEMVTWWIEAWDDGIWGYDKDTGKWTYDWERLDPARELTGLL